MRRRDFLASLGPAAALPFAAHAQQAMPMIGYLNGLSPAAVEQPNAIFSDMLKQGGYVDGQNVRVERRWAAGQSDRLPAKRRS
jgi:putative tryptophan/tyrosine transport system substrate-binding protein